MRPSETTWTGPSNPASAKRRSPTAGHTHRVGPWSGLAIVALLITACGGDDDAAMADDGTAVDEPVASDLGGDSSAGAAAEEPAEADTDEADTGDADAGGGAQPGSSLGLGEASVTIGDEVHRFALTEDRMLDGQCSTLFGVLAIDLPLVESNGAEVPPGTGWLRMDIELEDVADFEPYVEMRVAGGHWYAGASETAEISGVETPAITLAGNGLSVSGTQSMVPLVAGPGEAIDATVAVTCE